MQSLYFPPGDNVWLSLVLKHHGESAVKKFILLNIALSPGDLLLSLNCQQGNKKDMPKINAYSSGWHPAVYLYYPQISQAGIVRSDMPIRFIVISLKTKGFLYLVPRYSGI